jgi:hypothetical protein
VSVAPGADNLANLLGANDEIEIRRRNSLKDLFGTGAAVSLNKDDDGSASSVDEDVIYLVQGTSFASEIIYHDGSLAQDGYYVDGVGPFDGSTLTLAPDEPIMLMRKAGSPSLPLPVVGYAQTLRLTHYLSSGANPIGTGFSIPSPIGLSDLLESGSTADSDGSANPADDDLLYSVSGSSFSDEILYHDGSLALQGWYANGVESDSFSLDPGRGFILFVDAPKKWSEPLTPLATVLSTPPD